MRLFYFLESIIYGYNYEIQTWTGIIHKLTFIFLCVVIHINNSRVVPCGISCGTWLAQWFIQAAYTVAFVFEHERYIASAFHAAPLCAKTHIVSVAKISKLSCVYPTNQCDVIVNCACAALRNIWRFGFVGFKTKTKGKSTHVQLSMYTELSKEAGVQKVVVITSQFFCALSVLENGRSLSIAVAYSLGGTEGFVSTSIKTCGIFTTKILATTDRILPHNEGIWV